MLLRRDIIYMNMSYSKLQGLPALSCLNTKPRYVRSKIWPRPRYVHLFLEIIMYIAPLRRIIILIRALCTHSKKNHGAMYTKNPYQGAMYKSVHSAAIRILEKSRRYVQYRFVHIAVIWDLLGRYYMRGAMYKNVPSAIQGAYIMQYVALLFCSMIVRSERFFNITIIYIKYYLDIYIDSIF